MATECPKCHIDNPEDSKFCKECASSLAGAEDAPPSLTKTLEIPVDKFIPGTLFADRYEIIEELGRGGMGVVYKAEDKKLKRMVALKFLPPDLTHIPEVKERFMREAQAAAALDHPNICTVHEFDEAEGKTYITMAYIEGQDLREKTKAGPLEVDEVLKIATQVAEGLQIAHNKGVVHRDIKSANIMVTDSGQTKIMDFGLARMTGTTLLTQEGAAMGTIAYMSPEQAQGKEVDHRTDIWSFGVVLYEMLTGELPFKGEHEQAVVYSIRKDKPRPVTEVNAEIPQSIEQIVEKALEKEADKRYQLVDELLDDLKSISAGIVPEEINARLRKAKLGRRKRAILYAGVAGLFIAMVVIALNLFMGGRADAIESIAILPLENLTGDSEQEYFVDGITDELIGHLGQISGLRKVISRTSAMKYKETDKSLPEIAHELKVDAVVEGSVQQAGDRVRIRLQLIGAGSEEQNLWGQTYERAKNDVLVMCSEVTRAIAAGIQVKLTQEEESLLASARQVNPEAYEACIKGLSHFYRLIAPELDTALKYFESALEKDPNYALAHTGVALVWIARQQMGFLHPRLAKPKAKEAVLKALELDNTLAEAHYAMALFKTWSEWDWEGGEAEFLRALELKPKYPDAHVYYSNLLCYMGRTEEALEHAERALELDPLNSLYMGIAGNVLMNMRRYDDAIERFRTVLKTSPNDPVGNGGLSQSFHMKGMYEESLDAVKAAFSGAGLAEVVSLMEKAYEENGYTGAMGLAGDMLAKFSRITYISPFFISYSYVYAGNKNKALEYLEQGFEIGDPGMPYIIEPCFDTLRDDPRFQDLLKRMNLQ